MKKLLLSTTAVALVIGGAAIGSAVIGSAAWAGTLIEPLIEPEIIETATHSSSAGIVVPILLLLALALAIGSGGGGGGAISDRRLKEDIRRIGTTRFGLPLYRFRYRGLKQVFEGVMAQDVERLAPGAVVALGHGYKGVNYRALGLQMKAVA